MEKSGKGLLNRAQQDKVSEQRGLPVELITEAQSVAIIAGETAVFNYYSAGVLTPDGGQLAGTAVAAKFANGSILNDIGAALGNWENTSLSFTSTAFIDEVAFPYSVSEAYDQMSGVDRLNAIVKDFTNGQFCIDYRYGVAYGKKATAETSLTDVTYKVASMSTGGGGGPTANVNINQVGGATTATGAGVVTVGTLRVVEAQYGAGYYVAEDSSFVAGDSPVLLDVNAALARNGSTGYVNCDGSGSILVALSSDGAVYGSNFTLKNGETMSLEGLNVDTIRITHSGTDSSYRVFAK